jgi:AcrR family transcriptional regulator
MLIISQTCCTEAPPEMESESENPKSLRPPRRTEGVRVQGRSARVVEEVLGAVVEQLGKVGYGALRVEDVAAQSGVNKTTIYRRWPIKRELVLAALERFKDAPRTYDTGSLRGDLQALLAEFLRRVQTPVGRGIMRMVQAERADPDVNELLRTLRQRHQQARRLPFDRARERGEIPHDSDCALLAELLIAPVIGRVVHLGIEADANFLRVHVDMIVAGATAGAARPLAQAE